jgi:hypothetical protein
VLLAFAVMIGAVACTNEVAERCIPAGEVVATYESRIDPEVELTNAWMVRSLDPNLESWFFISATVQGGEFDGEIATWQLPGFNSEVDPVNTPSLSIAAEEIASSIFHGTQAQLQGLEPADYGVQDWSEIEGFEASRLCLSATQ